MSGQQARDALAKGCALAMAEIDAGADIIALGEMGIGNTASSALLVHRLTPAPLDDCIGVGAGQDDAGMARKRAAIARAAARSNASSPNPRPQRVRRARNRDDGRRGAGRSLKGGGWS